MAFTYSGDPGTSTRDLVRFLLSDTNSASPLFEDAELDYLITIWGDAYTSAIEACRNMIGREADGSSLSRKVGDLTISTGAGSVTARWQALISQLEKARFNLYPAAPVVNANSLLPTVERVIEDEGSDFIVGQMDNRT